MRNPEHEPPELGGVTFRTEVRAGDVGSMRALLAAIDVFYPEEREVAVELLEERLRGGAASGYHFVIAEGSEEIVGYASWGPIPLTRASFDLYWIVVDPDRQGRGLGRELLRRVERAVSRLGGGRLYIETSGRDAYAATRGFYLRTGCVEVARIADFYASGDDKLIYCKAVE